MSEWCEYCADKPVARSILVRDITKTDRGDWVQEYRMDLCEECALELEAKR